MHSTQPPSRPDATGIDPKSPASPGCWVIANGRAVARPTHVNLPARSAPSQQGRRPTPQSAGATAHRASPHADLDPELVVTHARQTADLPVPTGKPPRSASSRCDHSVASEPMITPGPPPSVVIMKTAPADSSPRPSRQLSFGLPLIALPLLAALGLPRVVLHDLHIIEGAEPASWVLALGPVAVWVAVTHVKKVPNPFLTVLTIGVIFGVMLAVTHQLLWGYLYADNPAFLNNIEIAGVSPRLAVLPGSLFAGTLLGVVGGLVARGVRMATDRNRHARPAAT